MWGTIVLGLLQAVTGMVLKYPAFFFFLDYRQSLRIHDLNSVAFTFFFLVSMITGIIMYTVPIFIKRRSQPNNL